MRLYFYLLLLILFDLAGFIALKFWHLKHNKIFLTLGMLSFALAALFVALSLKFEGIAIVNIIWVAVSAITVTLVGYYGFKEPIALHQFIGIAIIIIGLIFVQWKK